ncbi:MULTISPECIES: hemerythrin domain-containing protein [Rhodanobacter]|uniref:Hemerythrin domain-containing protein n=1 Tax=Rhodanobacter sp. IGA1.0 TaxID=3158582 RepID=A0AAU7QHD5_9GAMM|nr:hemerythrin domain-containing protein [Rhodanobacter spathiphylli]
MNFFGRKQQGARSEVSLEDQLAEQQVAPGTQLHYDSRLVGRLCDHAVSLLDLLALGGSAARESKFDEAERCLHRFRLLFNEHLLDKNLRLYTYLGCCLKSNPEGLEFMRNMRRETGEISRQTTRFLTRCQEVGISEEKRDEFLDELALIEDLLRHRFTREERSLYPMYRPPRAYQAAPAQSSSIGKRARVCYGLPC